MRTRIRTAAAVFALVLTACSGPSSNGGSSYGAGDSRLAAPAPGSGAVDPFLSNGNAVLRALDAIAARSGRPLRVRRMSADQVNGLSVSVQEPKRHVNLDQYVVAPDGTLSGPTPVRLISSYGHGPVTAAGRR